LEVDGLEAGAFVPDGDSSAPLAGEPGGPMARARGDAPVAARDPARTFDAFDAGFNARAGESAAPATSTSAGQLDRAGRAELLPSSHAEPPAATSRREPTSAVAGSPPSPLPLAQSVAAARVSIAGRTAGATDDLLLGRAGLRGAAAGMIEAAAASTSVAPHGVLSTDDTLAIASRAAAPASPASDAPARSERARQTDAGPPSAMQALSEALSKVNAWMAQPIEPRRAEPAPSMITAAPLPVTLTDASVRPRLDGDPAPAPAAPRLSIGHLEVEVVPPPPEPVHAPAARAQRAAAPSGLSAAFAAAEIAKLSFGTRGR
jgi:S-DNA-T family DNA segregation ATPase FtsK/SpoIIIE